jgi:hypothetical protein
MVMTRPCRSLIQCLLEFHPEWSDLIGQQESITYCFYCYAFRGIEPDARTQNCTRKEIQHNNKGHEWIQGQYEITFYDKLILAGELHEG